MPKKLFLLEQSEYNGWDTYDSCVICAENEEEAKKIHPASEHYEVGDWLNTRNLRHDWAINTNQIKATFLGNADESIELNSVICASFNAG
jgi:hypothetical protein